ncbi:MAG TPA: hypothetical protein VF185_00525 [Patescibacteria group bacterium]
MESTLILFTAAPTGLGHIRVMDALKDGLYPGAKYETVGLGNVNAGKIHSLGSRIPFLTKLTEFYQTNPLAERFVSKFYLDYLKRQKGETLSYLSDVAKKHPDSKFWVVISTHYALAFSILSVKKEVKEKFGVDIMLCVVVTDDSPQRVWAVKGADIIFAPSTKTRDGLVKLGVDPAVVKVISFPVSPRLAQHLSNDELQGVIEQLDPEGSYPMQIEIPVSGAAVQLPYLETIIKTLAPEAFQFTVIGLSSSYTVGFFERITKLPHVQTSIGTTSKQTVELYESLFYQPIRPAVEITKPSEQTFKAILKPRERGGVILLLTAPVGRQEYDNLNFLQRHRLMPNKEEQKILEEVTNGRKLTDEEGAKLHYMASHWRAIQLPNDPLKAASFIKGLRKQRILASMLSYVSETSDELTSDGVKMIWDEINRRIASFNKNI